MNWDELVKRVDEGLAESSAHIRALEAVLTPACDENSGLDADKALLSCVLLELAVSNLHSTLSHMAIGLEAVVGAFREKDNPQEVENNGRKGTS